MAVPDARKTIVGMRRGVGLIEMILVVGIVATLSTISLLSVNPQKQLLAARDAQRKSVAQQMQNAFTQGVLNAITFTLPTSLGTSKAICKQGITTITSCLNVDSLVPVIIGAIPQDSIEPCPNYSGYRVYKANQFINVFPMQLGRTKSNAYFDPSCYDAGGSPEIDIDVAIDGGGTTSLTSGQTFYPDVLSVGTHQFVFTVRNSGTGPMNLPSAPNLSGNSSYSVGAFTTGTLAASGTRQFTVTLDAATTGDYETTVSLASDDANENPFSIPISASITPVMPANLVGWFDATRRNSVLNAQNNPAADGEAVQTWFSSDNAIGVEQVTAGLRPIYRNSGPGAKTSLEFDGNRTYLVSEKVTLFAENENDFTIFVISSPTDPQTVSADVFDYSHGNDLNFAMEQDPGMDSRPAFTLNYKSAHWESIGPQPDPKDGLQEIFYQKSGKNLEMHVNNSTVFSGQGGSNFITGQASFSIGGSVEGAQLFSGNISEILIFARALSAAEVTNMETYLRTKYGY